MSAKLAIESVRTWDAPDGALYIEVSASGAAGPTPRLILPAGGPGEPGPGILWAAPGDDRRAGRLRAVFAVPRELRARTRGELWLLAGDSRCAFRVDAPVAARPVAGLESGPVERKGGRRSPHILVVDDDHVLRAVLAETLSAAGYVVAEAADGVEALASVQESPPDLIVSDVEMPDVDGLALVTRLRRDSRTARIPLIFLTTRGRVDDLVRGLELGADDYLTKPVQPAELVARVAAKLARRPVPAAHATRDAATGLLSETAFRDELAREIARVSRGGGSCSVAIVDVVELDTVRERMGAQAESAVVNQVASVIAGGADPLDLLARDERGRFLLLLPETAADSALDRLHETARAIAATTYRSGSERLRLTPAIGVAGYEPGLSGAELLRRAGLGVGHSAGHLDLRPAAYEPAMDAAPAPRAPRPWVERLRLPFQIFLVQVGGIAIPFLAYLGLDSVGIAIAPVMYVVVVVALAMTATLIWTEGFFALRDTEPPSDPGAPYPPASAVIAAYLPNEAPTLIETVEAFLDLDYPAPLQVILAYNTPQEMPIERTLEEIAARDPRLIPFRVEGSTSKAQNVNAALPMATGEFVGIFDADHQPQRDSYRRAWRWLSNGYDVVQGHCLVRNGDASWLARTVAVEFESIYSVSHPGRARLHGFGIFGGSNGYWRTGVLQETRMRGSMLTEDIDSALRAVEGGYRIASDRHLISRELAPTTLAALWNQRMRWAQGWFQVSLKHLLLGWRSPKLSLRNKLGLFYLLPWREIYPWLSLQMFPIIAFYSVKAGGPEKLDWMIPVFVLTTLYTLGTGPGQTFFAYRLGHPEIRARKRWFWWYLLVASLFYTELKNIIARVAHVKELSGERAWKVTPRTAQEDSG